jgi:hypothetical protein
MSDEVPTAIHDFDVVAATPEEFARALFDRPLAVRSEEQDQLGASGKFDPWYYDKAGFVRACTALFERFGELSAPYSFEQVEQGLWLIEGDPYFLGFYLIDAEVPREDAIDCVRSTYRVYADYLVSRKPPQGSGALYMWFDELWTDAGEDFLEALLETLEQILQLPDAHCEQAALHGLDHLHRYLPERVAATYEHHWNQRSAT